MVNNSRAILYFTKTNSKYILQSEYIGLRASIRFKLAQACASLRTSPDYSSFGRSRHVSLKNLLKTYVGNLNA